MQFEGSALSSTDIVSHHSTLFSSSSSLHALKYNLFHKDLDDNYIKTPSTTSSEECNSPTELNNCRRILEKPLVKRLTMGILRLNDDSRPLVQNKTSSLTSSDSIQTISDGYVNEAICDSEKLITSKFGDSCKQAFNHQTFQMNYPLSSFHNAIPLTTMKRSSSPASSSIITTATVHSSEKYNICYNNPTTDYNDEANFDYNKSFNGSTTSGGGAIPPVLPLRNDALSYKEQNDLLGAPWFQAGLPREISLEILGKQRPGAFLVRQSESKMGCFALSLRVPPPAFVAHYLIMRTARGFKIKGFTKEFSSLRALITHHSVMKEFLPIPLNLPRQHDRHNSDDLENLWFVK